MWDDLVAWLQSPGGARVLQTAIIPAAAIVVAGVLAALIGRAAVRSSIARADRVEAAGAVAGLVEAARAASEPDAERGGRRRAARLRTESDVRTRLLTLPNASLAADWAASRTDALLQYVASGPVDAELDELRDRLVEWVDRPSRAKRIFVAAPAAAPTPAAAAPPAGSRSRPGDAKAGPRRRSAPADGSAPAEAAAPPVAEPPAEPVVDEAAGQGESVPAWQRTRSGERLQQESAARARVDWPAEEPEQDDARTAPVQLPHAHRATAVSAAAAAAASGTAEHEDGIALEAHQQARHARPSEQPAPAAGSSASTEAGPAQAGVPAPAWLDDYDDEAHVTQNLDLKTPPPVSASAVRDRGGSGEDLVPRS